MSDLKNIYICFPGGKHKVLTLSFDDGREEDRRLLELFRKYGVKGAFNLNSGLHLQGRIPQSEYPALYAGQEVACHTALHPTIARSPIEQTARQVLEDRQGLERLMGYPVRGLAYPNGSYSQQIIDLLPGLGIRYARTVNATYSFAMPPNYLEWNPTCHFRNRLMELGEQFVNLHKTQYLYMMYVWGHSYELPEQGGWELLESFFALASGQEDTWYATNIEIVDYMDAASRLQFTMDGDLVCNPSFCSCWIEADGRILEIPGGGTVKI
ncbi:MAG: polysaccharide deacetylase family protein [Eubacteriales bacterium]|nr:polysaccharide deacetylase family protein [Eubacteriales bacterium]